MKNFWLFCCHNDLLRVVHIYVLLSSFSVICYQLKASDPVQMGSNHTCDISLGMDLLDVYSPVG